MLIWVTVRFQCIQHINDARTKWRTFSRRFQRIHFVEWTFYIFVSNFTEVSPEGPIGTKQVSLKGMVKSTGIATTKLNKIEICVNSRHKRPVMRWWDGSHLNLRRCTFRQPNPSPFYPLFFSGTPRPKFWFSLPHPAHVTPDHFSSNAPPPPPPIGRYQPAMINVSRPTWPVDFLNICPDLSRFTGFRWCYPVLGVWLQCGVAHPLK